jgi:radical SAM superfamily enzyme YgiQ (UPF0313 family)
MMGEWWKSLSPNVVERGATLTFGAGKTYATFDRTGRLLFFTEQGRAVRRGLDNRMVESIERAEGRSYRDLNDQEKYDFVEAIRVAINGYLLANSFVESEVSAKLRQIVAWTPERLANDEHEFREVYQPISILPPDHYRSLVIQVAEGCSYNRCTFCDFYRDRPFHIKSDAQMKGHLQGLLSFFGERMDDRAGIFLGDGNALVIPTERLLEIIQFIQQMLPSALFQKGMATFMDTFSLERKSLTELQTLRAAGLQSVYVGFETGDDQLRDFLQKQGTTEEAINAMTVLKRAGYQLAVIVLVGAGGEEFAESHVVETLAALQKLPLTSGDMIYLSPFVEPEHTNYQQIIRNAGYHALSADDLRTHYELLRQELRRMHPLVKVSMYSILQHLY